MIDILAPGGCGCGCGRAQRGGGAGVLGVCCHGNGDDAAPSDLTPLNPFGHLILEMG